MNLTLQDSNFEALADALAVAADIAAFDGARRFVKMACQSIYDGSDTRTGCIQNYQGDWLLSCMILCRELVNHPAAK
jgi:hypothetical protein